MMKPLVLALALLVSVAATNAHAQAVSDDSTFHRLLAGVVVAQTLDNVSTQLAMRPFLDPTGQPMAHAEVNPLLSSDRGANAVEQAITTVAVVALLHKMEPSHPRLARTLAYGLIGVGSVDTVHNLRVLKAR